MNALGQGGILDPATVTVTTAKVRYLTKLLEAERQRQEIEMKERRAEEHSNLRRRLTLLRALA
jgi:hypothetical protein